MALEWISEYGFVIAFYLAIILLVYFNRKKFHFEGKIVAMYRTKLGLKLMDKIGTKHSKFIKFLGVVGIYVGFLGMVLMLAMVVGGLYTLIVYPDAPALFSPVIPGVKIPGSPVKLPLIEGLLALFVVVVVHEFSHGVVARAYKLPIKSSGFVMFGPLPGAFVEPDEKKLLKSSKTAQLSIFAAGPFSNVMLFVLVLGVYLLGSLGVAQLYVANGVEIVGFVNETHGLEGGRLSSLSVDQVIIKIDDFQINTVYDVRDALTGKNPGDVVNILLDTSNKSNSVPIELTMDPVNESLPYLGLMLDSRVAPQEGLDVDLFNFLKAPIFWILKMLYWIWVLSLGIGIVNLLPIGPVDGGRMYLLALQKFFKKKEVHMAIWSGTAKFLLLLLIVLIFFPIVKAVIGF